MPTPLVHCIPGERLLQIRTKRNCSIRPCSTFVLRKNTFNHTHAGMCVPQHPMYYLTPGRCTVSGQCTVSRVCISHNYIRTTTAYTIVYTAMVQIARWAYTSLQSTPLQDFGAEKESGRLLQGGRILRLLWYLKLQSAF